MVWTAKYFQHFIPACVPKGATATSLPNPEKIDLMVLQGHMNYENWKNASGGHKRKIVDPAIVLDSDTTPRGQNYNPQECELCNKMFYIKAGLARHMKNIEGRKDHERGRSAEISICELCDEILFSKDGHTEHIKRHFNDKWLTCEHCGEKFGTCLEVDKHRVIQHEGICISLTPGERSELFAVHDSLSGSHGASKSAKSSHWHPEAKIAELGVTLSDVGKMLRETPPRCSAAAEQLQRRMAERPKSILIADTEFINTLGPRFLFEYAAFDGAMRRVVDSPVNHEMSIRQLYEKVNSACTHDLQQIIARSTIRKIYGPPTDEMTPGLTMAEIGRTLLESTPKGVDIIEWWVSRCD